MSDTRPTDAEAEVAAALSRAAEVARRGDHARAEALLRRALERDPGAALARANLALMLYRQDRPAEAVAELDLLPPEETEYQRLKAAALSQIGRHDEAIALYEAMLARAGDQPRIWVAHGQALKTVGRPAESIAAWRRAIALEPGLGAAWWGLANLKTDALNDGDVATMTALLGSPGPAGEDRCQLHFALGKALEDRGEVEDAFGHYRRGNRLKRARVDYDPEATGNDARRAQALFTGAFFAARAGQGCAAPDPIFVLGLPRSGSTLIEQILASHPAIEGTMELPDIPALARRLDGGASLYPECLRGLSAGQTEALGKEYLDRTSVQRRTGRPFFVDKKTSNWLHVGFIHLVLPRARIIDARRHPLACGFSIFRQYFSQGQAFAWSLEEIGLYYRDYAALMAHFDAVLPGRVHRVIHERLIADPEAETRALLDHLGLPFDPACLAFHENDRPVMTASAEQVRRPLNRDGIDAWRAFEPYLKALKEALGPALDAWDAP